MILHAIILSAAPMLVPQDSGTHELRFVPPSCDSLAIVGTETHDLLMESLLTRRGTEEAAAAPIELRLRSKLETVIADAFRQESGRLRRKYMDLTGRLELIDPKSFVEETGEWSGQVIELSSPFESVSVAFQPIPGQPSRFGRHYEGRALKESFLPTLEAPFDWGRFLALAPEQAARSVQLGDRWSLPAEVLQPLLAPSGFVSWRGDDSADEQILRAFQSGVAGNIYIGFDGGVAGKVDAEVKAVGGDSPQSRFVEFELSFDITLRSDRSDFVSENRVEVEAVEQVQTLGAQLAVNLKGGARLRWSVAENRPLGATVLCDEVVELAVQLLPPESEVVEQSIRLIGGLANRLEFRQVEVVAPPRSEGR